MSQLIDQSIRRVRAYAYRNRIRPSGLARAAGMGPNALAGMADERWDPQANTLRRLEECIPADFIAEEGDDHRFITWIKSDKRRKAA